MDHLFKIYVKNYKKLKNLLILKKQIINSVWARNLVKNSVKKKNTKDELLKKILHKRKRRKRKKLWIKTFTKKGRLLFKRKWKRYFIWKKRKHRKRIKNLFNFTYFFCKRKQFTPKLSRRWIFFQLRREELPSKVVDKIFEKIKWSVKLRRTFKLKKTLKKCF